MNAPAQLDVTRVLPLALLSLPIVLELTISYPLVSLAGRLVVSPSARSGQLTTNSSAIGRESSGCMSEWSGPRGLGPRYVQLCGSIHIHVEV